MAEWRGLTAAEVSQRLRGGVIGLWPIGATEQHGPHLVTGFDHFAAEAVARRAAERLAPDAVLLPTLAVGASLHWLPLGGTLSVTPATLLSVLLDVCRSAGAVGLERVVIVNGHAGNIGAGITAASEFREGRPVVEFVSYWDLVEPEALEGLARSDSGIGHAGEFETSIALHLGGLAREERIPAPDAPFNPTGPGGDRVRFHRGVRLGEDAPGGVFGDASAATPELGAALIEAAVEALVVHCRPPA